MLKCELCKNLTLEQYIHVCESGHTICCNCDDSSHSNRRSYSNKHSDVCINKSHINIENNSGKDLAGGDNIKIKPRTGSSKREYCNHFSNEKEANGRSEESHRNFHFHESTNSLKATLKYINSNYDGNNSSIVNFNGSKCSVKNTQGNLSVRPIICPVLSCKKTVALDSILKHFSFDHSKIPTLTLCSGKSLKIYLKPSNLSMNVQCIAIISSLKNSYPLMAAKIVDERWRTFGEKQKSETKSHSHVCSQNLPKNVLIRDYKNEIKDDPYCHSFGEIETDSDIIIWICRLTDFSHNCSITIKREHILSYNYTGEGLHIQNKQDPKIVADSPECLIIRRQSLSKLLDDKAQIHVYIKVFK